MSDSVETAAVAAPVSSTHTGQSGTVIRSTVVRRLLKNPLGIAALVILLAIALLAVLAPVLAPFEQNHANIAKTLAAPDSVNILGTDSAGRDVWSRLLFGAQLTLLSALLCAGVAIAIGLPAGLIAGYYAGRFEAVSNWMVSILMSLPGLIVLLTVRAAFGPSVWISMMAFGVLISPSYFRLTRTAVQSVRNELYVDAARVSRLSDLSIISRHIFSVVRAPIIIQTAAIAGVAIAIQSRTRVPGARRSHQGNLGGHALRRVQERLPESDPALLARACNGTDHRRAGPPRQRHPRRPGRRRKD
jgi:ABC-type dipeptide/oligopeptide/nickel transport system permease subunit